MARDEALRVNLPEIFERYREDLEAELRSILEGRSLPFYDMMRYHLGWADAEGHPTAAFGGKRLRPVLCLLACEALGGAWQRALPAAAALELTHNFSLIHDDIADGSPQRRHQPAVWRLWGVGQGVNAGDGLHVLARLALLGLERHGVSTTQVLQAGRLLDETCLRLCEGQFLDLSFEERLDITVADYLKMIEGKTAALIAASATLGALLAGDDDEAMAAMGRFGRHLGLAFQIRDDILGIWGEEEQTGKSAAEDIASRKKTLPIVYALQHANVAEGKRLSALYAKGETVEMPLDEVLAILEESGAHHHAQAMAEEHHRQALLELEGLFLPSWAEDALRSLADFLVERQF